MLRIIISTALLTAFCLQNSTAIVGGREVSITKHPYQVSLRRKTCEDCSFIHACGGVIYSDRLILTAAHCVYKREPNSFVVVAGSDLRTGSDGLISRVKKICIYEDFNPALSVNNIALVLLDTKLSLNGLTIKAAALADQEPDTNISAVVSGWGATSEGGANSYKLQEVEVNIINRLKCDANYGPERIGLDMICAGSVKGGKDACQYDSGGPLMINGELVGIVSWAIGCARPEYPGVYANVAYFKKWIESNEDVV